MLVIMDLQLIFFFMCLVTFWKNVAMEKHFSSRSLDKFIPLIIKPFDGTESKTGNKDFSLKTGTILPAIGKITKQDILDLKSRTRQPNKEIKEIADHDMIEHDPDTCPGCQSMEDENDSEIRDSNASKEKQNAVRTVTNNDDQNPPKEVDKPKYKEMVITKPFILHNNPEDADKKEDISTKPVSEDTEKKNEAVQAVPDPVVNGNLDVKTTVNPINMTPYSPFKMVKVENDYQMKQYQVILEPFCIYCNNNYPYYQNYNYFNGFKNSLPSYIYQNNAFLFFYPNRPKFYRKVWRNVVQTSKRNGEFVNRNVYSYSPPMFNNINWYTARPPQIGGYTY